MNTRFCVFLFAFSLLPPVYLLSLAPRYGLGFLRLFCTLPAWDTAHFHYRTSLVHNNFRGFIADSRCSVLPASSPRLTRITLAIYRGTHTATARTSCLDSRALTVPVRLPPRLLRAAPLACWFTLAPRRTCRCHLASPLRTHVFYTTAITTFFFTILPRSLRSACYHLHSLPHHAFMITPALLPRLLLALPPD